MESRLQQVLRSLCLKTGWKYAVFWKLKHRARMMLTWEDAYYDGNGYLDKKGFIETVGTTSEGAYSHDPLGLAMAKMPYEVYSLGEGVVGQVAVSGKHSWIFSDQHVADSSSSSERPVQSNCSEMPISPFSFRAGYELYEALGPPFQKQYDHVWETEKKGPHMDADMSEGMESCDLLMSNYDSDMHLLDAVVAKVSQKGEGPQSELTAEKTPCNSMDTISMTGFSSTSSSTRGSTKTSKKRAKPGESCRPRPRDRQLIQDRIKELRELVPNGSKCSIDSLLERSIKHMIFLQSVTKHADKLHKCSASELLDKDTGMRRFSCLEQGSSWAVEVGNNQKVYPIIVENINMNGHMLVEMLCEECTMFLEIAETIRSLGLTILKGVSEAYGNKTWVCFVVEGQNNRSMHRMDVLWSLMQLLQPKISN
ncbi:hypothetical protein MIMGU_mgv1a007015mg [Erythranthe guttata]|uniref:BHLH domain-containing protein n=1 Tax=Erythranthe guttata TaxID=4155 RepID=A0A022PU10_ERYGU|nr:hypothetical protein MIMGU_mgv1a007015mg [Erythranthe guttata]